MSYLALDLSKSSTGWCWWDGESARPQFGHWTLGSEVTTDGQVFQKLHLCLAEHWQVMPFRDRIYIEEPINPGQLTGKTTIQTIRLAIGLATHVQSFAKAYGLRPPHEINVTRWRADFIGKIDNDAAMAEARRQKQAGKKSASARPTLKALTMARCHQLGLKPRKDDEADAIGILTYAMLGKGITPPWLADEVLRPLATWGAA